jgi:phosphate transport system protein
MFDWLKRIQSSVTSVEEVLQYFEQMLEDGRYMFETASNTLLAGTNPEAVKADLWATDKRINRLERRIRRHVVTHLTMHGAGAISSDLVLMSIVKDAERIGDYCKNIFDLSVLGRGFPDGVREDLLESKSSITRLLAKARNIYKSEDEEDARAFIAQADALAQHCDARAMAMVAREDPDGKSAISALTYRYFKRILSHAINIITSVVVPVDQLDYYDEDVEGREDG